MLAYFFTDISDFLPPMPGSKRGTLFGAFLFSNLIFSIWFKSNDCYIYLVPSTLFFLSQRYNIGPMTKGFGRHELRIRPPIQERLLMALYYL